MHLPFFIRKNIPAIKLSYVLFRCSQKAPKPVCTEDLKKCKSADALFFLTAGISLSVHSLALSPGIEAGERHFCLATFPNLRSQLSTLGCFGTSLQSLWIRHPLGSIAGDVFDPAQIAHGFFRGANSSDDQIYMIVSGLALRQAGLDPLVVCM